MGGELELQREILEFLEKQSSVSVVWQNDTQRRRTRRYTSGSRFRPKGLPDVCGMFKNGTAFFVEIKQPGGKATEEQLGFLQKIKENGGEALLAFSVEMVKEWIQTLQP
jgi:hypothetical protein